MGRKITDIGLVILCAGFPALLIYAALNDWSAKELARGMGLLFFGGGPAVAFTGFLFDDICTR